MNTRNASVALVAAVSAMLAGNNVANAGLERVIKNTDAVPGIADVQWAATNTFQTPSIDLSGNVGFRGAWFTGDTITTANSATMYYGAPAGLNLVARNGDQSPGLPPVAIISNFSAQNLPLSPNGMAWFGSTHTAAPSGYI